MFRKCYEILLQSNRLIKNFPSRCDLIPKNFLLFNIARCPIDLLDFLYNVDNIQSHGELDLLISHVRFDQSSIRARKPEVSSRPGTVSIISPKSEPIST
jgi:hypothetical protein